MLLALLLAYGARLAPPLFRPPPQADPRPDIVIFMIDDVADSDIDVIATPNLDALAAEGVKFRRAYSHAKCHPTRDSFNFSRYLGLDRGDACDVPVPGVTHANGDYSFAEMLDGLGYHTLHVGKWHIGTNPIGDWKLTPELMGYDDVRGSTPIGPLCTVAGSNQPRVDDGVYSVTGQDHTIQCRDAFLDWWAETPSPKFAVVNFLAGHAPFKRPPSEILPPGTPNPINPTNRQEYQWEVQGVDFVIGEILPFLDDAYVVFTADNGTPGIVPGQDPAVTVATRANQDPTRVKLTCYEDGVRVPLIVRGPGIVKGHTSYALVHIADLFPTFAQILQTSPQPSVQGRGFGPALLGMPGPQAPLFVWNPPPRLDRAMIGPRWKLLTREDGVEELYDLLEDPLELSPLPPTGVEADSLRALRDALVAGGP